MFLNENTWNSYDLSTQEHCKNDVVGALHQKIKQKKSSKFFKKIVS